MKKAVFCVFLCVCLLCGCAPRAREYSAIATSAQTPYATQTANPGEALDTVQIENPPARFAVPAGWTVKSDAGLYTLTCNSLNATIEFTATFRIHPDYTYKKELTALEKSVRRYYPDADITLRNNYYELGDYSGIEMLYTFFPAGSQTQQTSDAIILFRDGYEYSFVLTADTTALTTVEPALSSIMLSLEIG